MSLRVLGIRVESKQPGFYSTITSKNNRLAMFDYICFRFSVSQLRSTGFQYTLWCLTAASKDQAEKYMPELRLVRRSDRLTNFPTGSHEDGVAYASAFIEVTCCSVALAYRPGLHSPCRAAPYCSLSNSVSVGRLASINYRLHARLCLLDKT